MFDFQAWILYKYFFPFISIKTLNFFSHGSQKAKTVSMNVSIKENFSLFQIFFQNIIAKNVQKLTICHPSLYSAFGNFYFQMSIFLIFISLYCLCPLRQILQTRRQTGWKWEGCRMEVAKQWITVYTQILWWKLATSILFDAFLSNFLRTS